MCLYLMPHYGRGCRLNILIIVMVYKGNFCQTLGLVLRLRVDFVLPLSQEQEQEQEEQEEEPLTKIYQWGVY